MSGKKKLAFAIAGMLLVACVYCIGRSDQEQRWLARRAREIVAVAGARDRRAQIVAVRDYVRRQVQHEGAPHDDRPFLRATAREILESGQGYCGESSRAFINLVGHLGIPARRINLYGAMNHVIVEVNLAEGRDILIDPSENPRTNGYFDGQDREIDSIVGSGASEFKDYSTIHLRRFPIVGTIIQRVRLRNSPITWIMEDPWLIKAILAAACLTLLLILMALDRMLIRHYSTRLGVRFVRDGGRPGSRTRLTSTGAVASLLPSAAAVSAGRDRESARCDDFGLVGGFPEG
jgi:Transglutaminase-like superfamily